MGLLRPDFGRFVRSPWTTGAAAFFLSLFVLGWLFGGPVTCRDGWRSPSIGKQGACSHHGGVDRSTGHLIFLVSLGIGLTAARFIGSPQDRMPRRGWSAPVGHATGYERAPCELPPDELSRLKAENAAAAKASEEYVRLELQRLDAEREARRSRSPESVRRSAPARQRPAKRRTAGGKRHTRPRRPDWLSQA